MQTRASAGDPIPEACRIIEVRVGELRQLFNAIDPSPFRERDLDPRAEEFIVEWARDAPRDAPLALVVYLLRAAGLPNEAAILRESIHEYFRGRATSTRRSLRELFGRGRISLVIGLAFLGGSIALGDALVNTFDTSRLAAILRESFLIGGWVAMWRPIEVFLYDWWPVRANARLFDRLSRMPVKIEYKESGTTDAWRGDWPAVPAADVRTRSNMQHKHTPDEERRIREAALDETIEGSFPASDPPSSNPNPDDHDAVAHEEEEPTSENDEQTSLKGAPRR